jgi:hypothetical protein
MVGASFAVAAVAQVLRSKNSVVAFGNAQVDTAQSKFGGASVLVDGTDDWIEALSENNWKFSTTENFTLEFWCRPVSTASGRVMWSLYDSTTFRVSFYFDAGEIRFYSPATSGIATGDYPTANNWFHYAITRSGGTTNFWYNGTLTHTTTTVWNASFTRWIMGGETPSGSTITNDFQGHYDEVRISNTARYTANFTPSTTPFVNDANTLLLIHADGTDATTFFEDDNGLRAPAAVMALGTAQIDNAQSQFGGTSIYFDGGAALMIPSTNLVFGTGNFTIEMWYRPTSSSAGPNDVLYSNMPFNASDGANLTLYHDGNRILKFFAFNSDRITAGTALALNTWHHIAVSRSGTSTRMFINGTQSGSTYTDSNNYQVGSTAGTRIGMHSVYNGDFINGWLDEIRVSNSARYTANFTPATQPFVNDANTLLLIHADGTDASTVVRDDNGYSQRAAKHISYYGNAQLDTAQSKFGGASALFDGSGDFLQTPNSSDFYLNSGNWTGECWFRVGSLQWTGLFGQYNDGGSPGTGWAFSISGNGQIYWQSQSSSFDIYVSLLSGNNVYTTNNWNHAAFVIENNVLSLYCNGNRVAQENISSKRTLTNVTQAMKIGCTRGLQSGGFGTSDGFLNGWMDEIRISNTARYTGATYTAPTEPFQNDANTVLLLHMDGADASTTFVDDVGGRSSRGIQAIGNAQIDTAQSKFGGASALFDGTGDFLQTGVYSDYLLGTGDFTIECWFRIAGNSAQAQDGNRYASLFAITNGNLAANSMAFSFVILGNSSTTGTGIQLYKNTNTEENITATVSISQTTWHHAAISKSGTSVRIFFNGTQVGSTTTSSTIWGSSTFFARVGRLFDTGFTDDFNGHIDELRLSNSARYTANFTPSTTPFQNDSNTLLLIHTDGTDGSTVFTDDNGIAPYTP